jgi:SOS-response transcriptional repressor LexA
MSETQQRVYEFIVEYIEREHFSPTFREIMHGVGIRSSSHVTYCLMGLEKQGLIERPFYKHARIRLRGETVGV